MGIKLYDAVEYENIKGIIQHTGGKHANSMAFVVKHDHNNYENITYKKMVEDINCLGTAMFNINLKGKRVAIIGRNRYEWVLAFLTNSLGGIVSVPLDKDLRYDELENSLIRSKADAIFFDQKYLAQILEIKKNNKTNLSEYICMDTIEGFISISELIKKGKEKLKQGNDEYIKFKINSDEMSILLFTSGTTSQAKAVMLSQRNIASNVYALQCVESFYDSDVNIAFLPFHHILGLTCLVMMLSSGVKTVFTDGLRYLKQNLVEYKVSVFVGVPVLIEAIYEGIMKEVDKQGKNGIIKLAFKVSNFLRIFHIDIRRKIFGKILDSLGGELRTIISGGAPADKKISKAFNDMGIKTLQGYGLSETSPVIAAENDKYMRIGSVGMPMPNTMVEIVNKDENGIGEIRVKGPNIMLGYYEMPEQTENVLKDGWFYTGDLGYLDKDGFLFITGRIKNMIVLQNGKKAFPEEIESLIDRLEIVKESMVFGMNNDNSVKMCVKIVYDKEMRDKKYSLLSDEDFYKEVWRQIKEINDSLPRYKHIQKMILTEEELIKTSTKKIKRHEEIEKISALDL